MEQTFRGGNVAYSLPLHPRLSRTRAISMRGSFWFVASHRDVAGDQAFRAAGGNLIVRY